MKSFLPFILLSSSFASQVQSQSCENEPQAKKTIESCISNNDSTHTIIDADRFIPISENILKVSGDVCIQSQNSVLSSEELFYNDELQTIKFDSAFSYQDLNQSISAQNGVLQLDNNNLILEMINYNLSNSNANGTADSLESKGNRTYLKALTYTTCPEGTKDWYIKAESADIDTEQQVGTFRNMTLRFKDVPILYLPYAKLPLSDQRKSGFLIPGVGYNSDNGFDFSLPYYLNIKENVDATLIPRVLTKRGLQLGAELRYLGQGYQGELYADYLADDKTNGIDRSFAEFQHAQSFNKTWSLNTHLKHVSDGDYFEDFGNSIVATSQSHLYSYLNLNGAGDTWKFKTQFNDYQIISDFINPNQRPYQKLPGINYSWFGNNYKHGLSYGVDAEWVKFYRSNSINTDRFDAITYAQKHFQNSWSRFSPRIAWRHTQWNYSDEQFSNLTQLRKERSQPIVSLDYELSFEKNFVDGGYRTLEPRLFFLYSPFRDQSDIPLFDTHNLTYGVNQLFQHNSFSSADRQSDANQITTAVSQRHFDSNGDEKWNLTLGQIHYFEAPKVGLQSTPIENNTSPLIAEYNYFYKNWKATASIHWDSENDETDRALLKLQRKGHNNSVINFAYRFRKGKIEQLDSSVVLPFSAKNRFIARWNYSLDTNKTIEALAGIEHKGCCWATRLVARKHIFNEQGDTRTGIYFELQLNGLGSIGRSPRRLLSQSILGYSEEF